MPSAPASPRCTSSCCAAGASAASAAPRAGRARRRPAAGPGARSCRCRRSAARAASTPFVGREAQLERLRTLWLQAGSGTRRFALLVGEPGIGKTRLAGAASPPRCTRAGATVLYGRCDEEPLLPYQPFVEALRHYLRHGDWAARRRSRATTCAELARLLPEARPPRRRRARRSRRTPTAERYRLFEAVARAARRADAARARCCSCSTTCTGPTSRRCCCCATCCAYADPARLLVLGIVRDVEVDADHPLVELLADLRRERRFDRLALDGPRRARDRRARRRAPRRARRAPASCAGCATQTEGNPFFIEETLRALVESHARASPARGAGERRWSRSASPRASPTSSCAASAASPTPPRDVLTVGGRRRPRVRPRRRRGAARHARRRTCIDGARGGDGRRPRRRGRPSRVDRFTFCHALVRDALYGRLSRSRAPAPAPARRRGARGRARRAARRRARAPLLRGARARRRRAGRALRRRAPARRRPSRSPTRRPPRTTAARWRRSRADPDGDEARRCDMLLALGRVQWRAGDAAARETYFEAAASARARGDAEQLGARRARPRRALLGGQRGRRAASSALLAEALEALPARGQHAARAADGAPGREPALHRRRRSYGTRLSAEAVAMARRLGDADTLVMALMGRHVDAAAHRAPRRAPARSSTRCSALARRAPRADAPRRYTGACSTSSSSATSSAARRDHAELTRARRRAAPAAARAPRARLAGGVRAARRRRRGGRAARARVASSVAAARRCAPRAAPTPAMLFTLRRHQGRVDELLPAMQCARRTARRAPPGVGARRSRWRTSRPAPCDEGRARYERARRRRLRAPSRATGSGSLTIALLAETCARAARRASARRRCTTLLEPFADRYVQVIFTANWGSVQRHLGLLAGGARALRRRRGALPAALDGNERIGAVLMTAETQCAYGALLLRRGARRRRASARRSSARSPAGRRAARPGRAAPARAAR